MDFLADILLMAGAAAAAGYCLVLGQRLRRFTDLEKGMGAAVAVLSAQVDDLSRLLDQAEGRARLSAQELVAASARAEAARDRLDLMLAAMHDIPADKGASANAAPKVFLRHGGGMN